MDPEIKVVPDAAEVAHEAAERVIAAASRAADEGRTFSIALSGGSTPKALFELLATDPYKSRIDWAKVEVFFGDERTVPPDHKDSNYRMAREALLSKVPIPGDNVYRMAGERDPNTAAREYGARAIGIDIGGTKIAGAVVDELGTIVEHDRRPTSAADPQLSVVSK